MLSNDLILKVFLKKCNLKTCYCKREFPFHKYFLTKFDFGGVLDVFADTFSLLKRKSKIIFPPEISDLVTIKDAFSLHFNRIETFLSIEDIVSVNSNFRPSNYVKNLYFHWLLD